MSITLASRLLHMDPFIALYLNYQQPVSVGRQGVHVGRTPSEESVENLGVCGSYEPAAQILDGPKQQALNSELPRV